MRERAPGLKFAGISLLLLVGGAAAGADPAAPWSARCEQALAESPAQAEATATEGLQRAGDLALADPAWASLLVCRGYAREQAGKPLEALADYRSAVAVAKRGSDRVTQAQAQALEGEALHFLGRYAEAMAAIQAAYRTVMASDSVSQQAYVLNALANLYADAKVGEFDQALEVYTQLLALRRAAGKPAELATTEFNIASTLEKKGDLVSARAHFETALSLQRQSGEAEAVADVQRALGNVLVKMGEAAAALPLLDAALAALSSADQAAARAHVRLTRGTALAALGRAPEALSDLESALDWYEAQDNPRFLERIHEERAGLYARLGRWQDAYVERMAAFELRQRLAALLREEQTARLRTQFDVERREQENAALRREQELAAAAIRSGERARLLQTILLIAGAVVLLAVGALLQRLRRRNRALAESNAALSASRAEVVRGSQRADLIFKALTEGMAGEVLDGKYRLKTRLGAGGFGTVYRAEQVHLGTTVAVKVFKPIAGHDAEEALKRFRSEGVSAFRVQHPNAVRVLDFGVALDTVAYLAMEFLDGLPLDAYLRQHGRLPWPQVVHILHPIAAALAAAHAAGVIHRDVKPSNILICREADGEGETVKLIDFGIAKVLSQDTPAEVRDLTATGMFMGTPSYMAPERFVERPFDGRADVYALGVVGFELLSGRRPFVEQGEAPTPLSVQHLRDAPPDLAALAPGTPAALLELIAACLAKRVADRPSAAGLENCLAVLLEPGMRLLSVPVSPTAPDAAEQATQLATALTASAAP